MEERVHAIHTTLTAVENSIAKFENSIEECQMLKDEAHQMEEEEESQDQPGPEGEIANIEMIDQEELGDPESSSPQMEADTEDNPPLASDGDVMFLEEESALLADTPPLEESSPGSETARISGEMAELQLTSPAHPGTEEGEASKVSTLLRPTLRRRRPFSKEHQSTLFEYSVTWGEGSWSGR